MPTDGAIELAHRSRRSFARAATLLRDQDRAVAGEGAARWQELQRLRRADAAQRPNCIVLDHFVVVEERGGKIYGYEFKWSVRKKVKPPRDWTSYQNSEFKVITPDNYLDFIT